MWRPSAFRTSFGSTWGRTVADIRTPPGVVWRRLKQGERTRSVPVIVISALDLVEEKLRAFDAGAADYVTKPFEPREVLSRVGAHVQLYRLRRELETKQAELAQQNEELMRKND